MAAELYRLVYYSRNVIPGPPEGISQEIDSILAASRRNNGEDEITGALMFNSGVFAQALEGPRAAIERVFERIQRDERHGDVMVLAFEPVKRRDFPSWSMAFVGRSQEGERLFSHIGETTGFDARRLEGERVFGILRDLVLDEERAVA